MSNNLLLQLTEDQFKHLLKDCIRESIEINQLYTPQQNQKLLNIQEAAKFLNLATQTLYSYTSNRKIPFIKKGKKVYFKTDELTQWLNEGRILTKEELGSALTISALEKIQSPTTKIIRKSLRK